MSIGKCSGTSERAGSQRLSVFEFQFEPLDAGLAVISTLVSYS